jgi:predicted transcriptional regulator
MNDKNLIILTSIEKTKSLTKSADLLGLSQPSVSRTLKLIEQELGFKVFFRLAKKLELTKEGHIYLSAALKSLAILNEAKNKISQLHNSYIDEVSVGVHPVVGRVLIPEIDVYFEKSPLINLTYTFDNSRELIKDVLESKLDLAIVADAKPYPELIIIPLWKEYIGLYSANGRNKPTILYNSNMIFAQKILKRIEYECAREIKDYDFLADIIKKSSNSMGLLPSAIADSKASLKLIKYFKPDVNISLVYRSDKTRRKSLIETISIIKKYSRSQ